MRIQYKATDGRGQERTGYAEPHAAGCISFAGEKPELQESYKKAGWTLLEIDGKPVAKPKASE